MFMSNKKVRSSNLELLRMLAMIMVISLHLNGSANTLAQLTRENENYFLIHLTEAISICSVNCFVLISGYFMINKHESPMKKLLMLLVDVAFWSIVGIGLSYAVWGQSTGMKEIVLAMIPYIKGGRWFVRDYIILSLLAPFLNVCLTRLTKRSYQILLVVMMLFLSVWPSFFPNPPIDDYGFSFTHFILLYAIAGYLRLHMPDHPKAWKSVTGYIVSVGLIFVSSIIGIGYAYAYNYVFVITAAVSLLLLFRGMRFQSGAINWLAAGAFDVFVIHTTGFFADLIYTRLFHFDTVIGDSIWKCLLVSLVCPPAFYLFSRLVSEVKVWVYRFSVDRVVEKLPIKNYYVD